MGEKIHKSGVELHGQTETELKREITSSKKTAKMTMQRREYFGLRETKELTPERRAKIVELQKPILSNFFKAYKV